MAIDCGWDIGGVHLKVACLRSGGASGPRLVRRQEAFEIWRAPGRLAERMSGLLRDLLAEATAGPGGPTTPVRHAVTMTAELSDVFPDRRAGVRAILAACAEALGTAEDAAGPILILGTGGELVPLAEAGEALHRVAAANWAASARLAARLVAASAGPATAGAGLGGPAGQGLLIDVGSTTTDVIPLQDGRADPEGRTDLERLLSGELIYTGLLRTPPSALADRVPFGDGWCRVAPEAFTNMGDVYILLGRIGPGQYTVPAPDGRGHSREECAARLARLVCAEPRDLGSERLGAIAAFLEDRQVERIADAIRQVLSRRPGAAPLAIVAGSGWFLGETAARRAGLKAARLSGFLPALGADWDAVAPAAALAILQAEAHGERDLIPPDPA